MEQTEGRYCRRWHDGEQYFGLGQADELRFVMKVLAWQTSIRNTLGAVWRRSRLCSRTISVYRWQKAYQ